MLTNSKRLVNVPVHTRSGTHVGKVASLDFDVDTGRCVTLHVKHAGVVSGLLDQEVLIAWRQIVSIQADNVIVEDSAVTETRTQFAKGFTPSPAQRGASLHERSTIGLREQS